MGSKFFTWTKGDRRNASEALHSGGIVPIPVECIKIKGMDYARSEKGKSSRKPPPLTLDDSPEQASRQSSRTSGSIALHDAAVQSATSLMAVMNDMLRTPQLSSHLNSTSRMSLPTPRPRSHTAPSTPLAEAPVLEPAELPGSLPKDRKPNFSHCRPINPVARQALTKSSDNSVIGESITRPHSSPQEPTHNIPNRARMSIESFYGGSSSPRLVPVSKSTDSPQLPSAEAPDDVVTKTKDEDSVTTIVKRPSLSILQHDQLTSPSLPGSVATSHAGSSCAIPKLHSSHDGAQKQSDASQQIDVESMYIQQIIHMRSAHEVHLKSLKEAHEKEVASHQSYIDFLEKKRGLLYGINTPDNRPVFTLDVSPSESKAGDAALSAASETTLPSIESSIDARKRDSVDPANEAEALKRKISLYRREQADAIGVRRERDELRDSAEKSSRRVLQLKDIVRKAKENEKALKNANADLEARLVLANNERTDVLEGFHEASQQVRALSEREKMLSQELENLNARGFHSHPPQELPSSGATLYNQGRGHRRHVSEIRLKDDLLSQQLNELRVQVKEKDARIQQLEQSPSKPIDNEGLEIYAESARIQELETALKTQKKVLATAQADTERYNNLLHAELRKQTRQVAEKVHTATPKLEAEAFVIAAEKMMRLQARIGSKASDNSSGLESSSNIPNSILEKELEHCIKEIILYKLDVRNYKKDLKKANAKIETLEALSVPRPPTPGRDSPPSARSYPSVSQQQGQTAGATDQPVISQDAGGPPGLGICFQEPPKTPTKGLGSIASGALLPTTPSNPGMSSTTSSPSMSRPKTPLGTHKKLPKPPSSPAPPGMPSNIKKNRSESLRSDTQRSLSESIISSYANRTTPEQGSSNAQPSGNTSESLRSRTSPMAPLSKFASQ